MGKDYSPNDMRSMAMNSNSSHYQAAMDNHSNQMNSNNDAYWSSRGGNDYYGLDDYYGESAKETFIKDIKPLALKAIEKFETYKNSIEDIKDLNPRSNKYKELIGLINSFKLTGEEVELVLGFNEFNVISEKMIIFLFEKLGNYDLLFKISKYGHLNDFTFNTWIEYTLERMNKDYYAIPISETLMTKGIDKVKESYIKKITEHYNDKDPSYLCDAAIIYTGMLVNIAFGFIRSCVLNDNIELAKRVQEYFKLNEELFNSLEYKKNEIDIGKYRSLYNTIPDNDEWIKFLLSIGAKASSNEITHLYRRLFI